MFSIKSTHIRYIALVLMIALFGGAFWYVKQAQGVTRTWDGGGADANWNTPANWSGDTVPTSADVAQFDGTCASNCSPTINVTLSSGSAPAGINMASDYAGTITQAAAFAVGTSGWIQNGGTFIGGSQTITLNGDITLAGGTFTSTSGTLSLRNVNFTHTAGGTFNHNNGTLSVWVNNARTIDVATSETLNNFTVDANNNVDIVSIASGDTLIVLGTFTHDYGTLNTGTVEARGNVVVGVGGTGPNGGSATVTMLVAGDQTITGSGGTTGNLNINKPSGTVTGSGDFGVGSFTLTSGTFTSTTGTLTVRGNFTHTAGGTFNHNNGTVELYYGTSFTIDVATTETFNNLTGNCDTNTDTLTIASGDTLIVLGTFTHTNGGFNTGTVEARSNVSVSAGADGGSALLSLTGSNDQAYTDSGGNEMDGDITINKTGGIVALLSNADWNASGQDLTITAGTLKVGSTYALTTTALTVGASGVLKMVGTGDLTLAGNVANDGQIIIENNQTCGGTDDIQILSSVAGTQRAWSGAGTVTVYDATVKDQGGSLAITAYSSTSVSGNGANWTFSGAACPTIAPALNITSGLLNIGTGIVNFR